MEGGKSVITHEGLSSQQRECLFLGERRGKEETPTGHLGDDSQEKKKEAALQPEGKRDGKESRSGERARGDLSAPHLEESPQPELQGKQASV